LLTFSFKADGSFMETVKNYAWEHRTSIGELIRQGLTWRLGEGDPLAYRFAAPPPQGKNGNTAIPEKAPVAATTAATPPSAALPDSGESPSYGDFAARVLAALKANAPTTPPVLARALGKEAKSVWQSLRGLVRKGEVIEEVRQEGAKQVKYYRPTAGRAPVARN